MILNEQHGYEGLLCKNSTYSGQFKIDVLEYMPANHLTIMEMAAQFAIASHPYGCRDYDCKCLAGL